MDKSRRIVEIITKDEYLGIFLQEMCKQIRLDLENFRYDGPLYFMNIEGDELTKYENLNKKIWLSFGKEKFRKISTDLGSSDKCIRPKLIDCINISTKESVNFELVGGRSYLNMYEFFKSLINIPKPPDSPDFDLKYSGNILVHKRKGISDDNFLDDLSQIGINDFNEFIEYFIINEKTTEFNSSFLYYIIECINIFIANNRKQLDYKLKLLEQKESIVIMIPNIENTGQMITNDLFILWPRIDMDSMRVNIEIAYQDISYSGFITDKITGNNNIFRDHIIEFIFAIYFKSMSGNISFAWNQKNKNESINSNSFSINGLLVPNFKKLISIQAKALVDRLSYKDIRATKKAVNDLKRIRWLILLNNSLYKLDYKLKNILLPCNTYSVQAKKINIINIKNNKGLYDKISLYNLDSYMTDKLSEFQLSNR